METLLMAALSSPAPCLACPGPAINDVPPSCDHPPAQIPFRHLMGTYLRTGKEADLHQASQAIRELLSREDDGDVLDAIGAVHAELEKSVVNARGRRALDLALAMQIPALMTAFICPTIARRLSLETLERRSLEEDVRAATLALAREREFLETRVAERTADLETIIFLASHDLRAPGNAIELSCDALRSELKQSMSAEIELLLGAITTSARRILSRLGAFVEFCRADERREESVIVDLETVVDDAWCACHPPSTIRFEKSIDLERARVEPGIMRVILEELFDNAVFHGGASMSVVAVRIRSEGRAITIEVVDDGHGIPIEDRQRIFRPFETLDRHSGNEKVGVGLALVHKFLQLRGARIVCEEDPLLGGSCFRIVWPQQT